MKKLRVGILFGGRSGEHEVSITSAMAVRAALDPNRYDVVLLGIDKSGRWLLPSETKLLAQAQNPRLIHLNQEHRSVALVPYESKTQIVAVDSSAREGGAMPQLDVVIPILHGTYGEDGTIQGLLELSQIPYVGSGVLGSAIGMDKDVSRRLLKAAGIPVVPTVVIRRNEFQEGNSAQWVARLESELGLPYFVKPANAGSSVGVGKVKSKQDALAKIHEAFEYDNKILVEKAIAARELECSVLGNDEPRASGIGEIIPQHEFYSYEAKYIDANGARLEMPAQNVSQSMVERIQTYAVQAFQVLECRGLARVDFFLDRQTGELFLNEINTMPGFTQISMYPKLWEHSGLKPSQLWDELIRLALEAHSQKSRLKTEFTP